MEVFQTNGHLTDAALTALVRGEHLEELARLEISEHLSYCDHCLQRYITALEHADLLTPLQSCRETLWHSLLRRTFRLSANRYATAAVAVALALTLVWGSEALPAALPEPPDERPVLSTWWNASLDNAAERLEKIFYHFDLSLGPARRGADK